MEEEIVSLKFSVMKVPIFPHNLGWRFKLSGNFMQMALYNEGLCLRKKYSVVDVFLLENIILKQIPDSKSNF